MKGRISEVFESVQGEGPYVGERQLFVRFYGCNLSCKFCDTRMHSFMEYYPEELINELKLYQDVYHSVSYTGGEPLMQKDFLKESLRLAKQEGFNNYLETNGILYEELAQAIDWTDIIAMDWKLPSSTGGFPCWKAHKRFLEIASQKDVFVKLVICESTQADDFMIALKMIKEVNPLVMAVLQPNSQELGQSLFSKINFYKVLCEDESITSCMIPQVHKFAGVR